MDQLKKLLWARAELIAKRDALLIQVRDEKRDNLTAEEDAELRSIVADLDEKDKRIEELAEQERRDRIAADAALLLQVGAPAVTVRSEPLTYNRGNRFERSYFQDLANATVRNDVEAHARLQRHAQELDTELPARDARREAIAEKELRGIDHRSFFEKRVNPNRTDGQGGYFVPPLWLVDEYIPALRAGRVFIDQVRNMDLPNGTDSINIPKLSTGTATGVQTSDGASVTSTDLTDTFVTAPVKTIAGQQDVAIQLLDQSPINFDELVFTDLMADYNAKADGQGLAGTGSSGQVTGIYPFSNWTSSDITYDDASPTVPETWTPFGQALSKIATNRFDLSSLAVFMHPRRWFWMASALDSSNRPLVLPNNMPRFNGFGGAVDGPVAQGYVGQLFLGAPVFIDANITTTDTHSSGSNQDVIICGNTQDAIFFEGTMRTRALPEVLSGTLQVRLQVYNYVAFLVRYGKAFSIIGGTGLAAPSGF